MRFFALTLVLFGVCFGSDFAKSKENLIKIYSILPQKYRLDFYCLAPFSIDLEGNLNIIKSKKYSPRKRFTNKGKINKNALHINFEHIMPVARFAKDLPCYRVTKNKKGKNINARQSCAKDERFKQMEGDINNIAPAIAEINLDRNNFAYADAPLGLKFTQYGNCKVFSDFKNARFYPAPHSKGKIARAYLYMSKTYNIKLDSAERELMERWDREYPPTQSEEDERIFRLFIEKLD